MSHPAIDRNRNGAEGQPQTAAPAIRSRIVLDAMGGDNPVAERLAGAVDAARAYSDVDLIICGPAGDLECELDSLGGAPGNVRLVDAPEHIGMHEKPIQALREKRRSTIGIGVDLVARGEADAFVSAGNTGAVAAASTLKLGRLKHVHRPGIAAAMRVIDHTVVAIDVGANVACKPAHLLQYGLMASVFAREVLGMKRPRVGLLNVGEEEAKGHDLIRQTFEMLAGADLDFIGNVEPEKLVYEGCDVVVCDGFVGNVLLKFGEGLVTKLGDWFRAQVPQRLRYKLGFLLCKDLFAHLKSVADASEYGGAPLLGVNGVTIIAHGSSDARAICNAIREARSFVAFEVNDQIEEAVRNDTVMRQVGA